MQNKKISTQTMVKISMFTAVLAVLSILQIPLPSGVPLTMQTFAVALCGYVLGSWAGTGSVALYLAVGAIGVPVFAGMRGGIAVLIGPTGGFLLGFLFLAWMCGAGIGNNNRLWAVGTGIAGLACCHLAGIIGYILVTGTGFLPAFVTVSMPYLIKDTLSVVLAKEIGGVLRQRLVVHLID